MISTLKKLEHPGVNGILWCAFASWRARFTAYSYGLNAEFGFRFLLFYLQYIRATRKKDLNHIRILDNEVAVCLGSKLKKDEWILSLHTTLQAHLI